MEETAAKQSRHDIVHPKISVTNADTPSERPQWHSLSVHDVADELATERLGGLSEPEAQRRLTVYGLNELRTIKSTPWYRVLARQFVDVLILILVLAAAISLLVGRVGDSLTILAIVFVNGILGFIQEWRAERALEALQKMLTPHCRVVRDGEQREIDSRDLVPGDVVLLEIGNRVSADLRLVESLNLKVDESMLTGESHAVHKDVRPVPAETAVASRSPIVWMGSTITNGRASGLVVSTGMSTEFGRIASLTQTVGGEATPLQKKLGRLGINLGLVSIAISVFIALLGWALGKELVEMFMTGVALAVAIVPEALPVVVTVTLALGVRAMVRKKALMRRLQASETLGAATVICSDKTGTLTANQMTVTEVWLPGGNMSVTGTGYDPAGHFRVDGEKIDYGKRLDLLALLETGMICNHAELAKHEDGWHEHGEPTEAAILVAAYKAWLSPNSTRDKVSEFSFNSVRKRMTVVSRSSSGLIAHSKGAPEVILERCTHVRDGDSVRELSGSDRENFELSYHEMAKRGLRVLAVARRELPDHVELDAEEVERDLTLLGFVGLIDPPRPEVRDAIRIAQQAGIRIIMITGDAAPTAQAIAKQIGLTADRTVTGREFDKLSDGEIKSLLARDVIFARTTPEEKLRLVRLLQDDGQIVGMTGDGVNDAPALKQANIGIAMGKRGTDVAKNAADMILTDDNFASIVGAIEEGRRQYDNIRKFVRYILSSHMGEVTAILVNVIMGGPLILVPVQILWMNMVTDGVTAIALGLEPGERDRMSRPPRHPDEPIPNRRGIWMVLALGAYIGFATLWLFHYYMEDGAPENIIVAQTVAFTGIIVLEKVNVFNFRSLRGPLSTIGWFSNKALFLAIAATLGAQALAVYTPFLQNLLHTVPLAWQDWALILAVALPLFVFTEIGKRFTGLDARR